MKSSITIIALMLLGIFLAGCSTQNPEQSSQQEGEMNIAATFFPLYDITKKISGENATVLSVVPQNIDPHGFELSPQDIVELRDIDAYVALGVEFEGFEEEIIDSLSQEVNVIHAGETIELLSSEHSHEDEQAHEEENHSGEEEMKEEHHKEDAHEHEGVDPHIWLSPKNMQEMAQTITDELSDTYPEQKTRLENNNQALQEQLEELHKDYTNSLSSCEKDTILVNHNAFSYLAATYNFSTITVSGLRPESEPTPGQLAELIDKAEDYNLTHIFYEELADPRIVETIAAEANLEILELNPAAGTKSPDEDYFTIMRENLNNLETALHCS